MTRDEIKARREELRRSIERWQDILEHGCSDTSWPDGTNMNLLRNQIIALEMELVSIGEGCFSEIPPEVPERLMIQNGEYFQERIQRIFGEHSRPLINGIDVNIKWDRNQEVETSLFL